MHFESAPHPVYLSNAIGSRIEPAKKDVRAVSLGHVAKNEIQTNTNGR